MNMVLVTMGCIGLFFFVIGGYANRATNVDGKPAILLGAFLMILALGLFLIWIMPFVVMQWVFSIFFVFEMVIVLAKLAKQ
jgi:hypothetical protein